MSTQPTQSQLTDTLPSTVPHLESDGSNWPIFNLHFQYAIEVKGFWGHFDGTTTHSSPIDASLSSTAAQTTWDQNECSCHDLVKQLSQCLLFFLFFSFSFSIFIISFLFLFL